MCKYLRNNVLSETFFSKSFTHIKYNFLNSKSFLTCKTFSEIPGPKVYPLIGSSLDFVFSGKYKYNKIHHAFHDRFLAYGPIYKETFGRFFTSVVLSDFKEYLKVIQADGSHPNRMELGPILEYRRQRNIDVGLINSQGEEWYNKRFMLAPKLLNVTEVSKTIGALENVTVSFLQQIKKKIGRGETCDLDLEHFLFLWALESIGIYIFGKRIGCLEEPPPHLAARFVRELTGLFGSMQELLFAVPLYKYLDTPKWKRFKGHYENIVATGLKIIKNEELFKPSCCQVPEPLMSYLVDQRRVSPEEANSICVDLMTAAVDTGTTNKKCQEKLFEEIKKELPSEEMRVTEQKLGRLKYLKACVKETLRLFPVAYSTSRRISRDLQLFGYHVPKGTNIQGNLFTMGRDETLFKRPSEFLPERWLKGGEGGPEEVRNSPLAHMFSNIIFGHGPRMCIGRRLAELEINIFLLRLLRNFEFERESKEPLDSKVLTVLTPAQPLRLKFKQRI